MATRWRAALRASSKFALVVVLLLVGLASVGCSLRERRNPDPRAYDGSASDVSLDEALDDNGIKIPGNATGIRFAVETGRDEILDLTFDLNCDAIPRFLADSSMKSQLESTTLLPSLVEMAGRDHDWNIESYSNPRGIEDDRMGEVLRSVIVVTAEARSCKVFLSAIR